MTLDIGRIAQELHHQHRNKISFQPLKPAFGVGMMVDAYRIQDALVALVAAETGTAAAGYKIGLTTKRMQAFCGIDQPIAGVVLADRVVQSGARLDPQAYGRLGIEFEICVRLGCELPGREAPYLVSEVAAAIDGVCAAVEIVDDRGADYAALDAVSLVADNSWNAGVVLGAFRTPDMDLAAAVGTVTKSGETIGSGTGADVLGHPLAAVAWLADHLGLSGRSLRAGDLVMTGSMVTTRFPEPGDAYHFDIAGLGTVEVTIG
jgi:2-oxo-3-hexenedioate decarboxylase/2-keto-4-pentenoate hydratase